MKSKPTKKTNGACRRYRAPVRIAQGHSPSRDGSGCKAAHSFAIFAPVVFENQMSYTDEDRGCNGPVTAHPCGPVEHTSTLCGSNRGTKDAASAAGDKRVVTHALMYWSDLHANHFHWHVGSAAPGRRTGKGTSRLAAEARCERERPTPQELKSRPAVPNNGRPTASSFRWCLGVMHAPYWAASARCSWRVRHPCRRHWPWTR